MSEFKAIVHVPEIKPHPNADRIELCEIGGYQSIIAKGSLNPSEDLIAYIPEKAIVPHWLLEEMELADKLAGKGKNRVKTTRMRGVITQGICYRLPKGRIKYKKGENWREEPAQIGEDVTEKLGITKHTPPPPPELGGNGIAPYAIHNPHTLRYEIEDIKQHNHVLRENERVIITEKLHGTWFCVGHRDVQYPKDHGPYVYISSKGLAAQGYSFHLDNAPDNLIYKRIYREYRDKFFMAFQNLGDIQFIGEIYGTGVQDLHYGTQEPELRIFDIFIPSTEEPYRWYNKNRGINWYEKQHEIDMEEQKQRTIQILHDTHQQGFFLEHADMVRICGKHGLPYVPTLYKGPYNQHVIEDFTKGHTTYQDNHIREGIVIKATPERTDKGHLGRVILKSINEDYMFRKGGTEFE